MIRYYSASRRRDRWTAAADWMFLITMPLAVVAVLLTDAATVRVANQHTLTGRVLQGNQPLRVTIDRVGVQAMLPGEKVAGMFELSFEERRRGWPLTTTIERMPGHLSVDLVSEPAARKNVRLKRDDPLGIAIHSALDENNQHEAIAAMNRLEVEQVRHWLAWPLAVAVWWIVFLAASITTLSVAKYAWRWSVSYARMRKARLSAEGKCAGCGYDLRGLEFADRCPECGSLVW